jgi:tight adherence protein B
MRALAASLRPRRRLRCTLGALVAGGLLAAPSSGAAPSLHVSEGGGVTFPGRSLVLAVPGRAAVARSEVHISENGRPVSGALVTPIAEAGAGDFGVVLAIDVSPSMKGEPLARAMAAARALAAQRTGKQALAVVTFDHDANVVLPLTDEPQAIARVLAHAPPVGPGALIYNALTVAVQQLADAKIAAGAVILLSDGASEGAAPRPGHNLTASSVGAAAAAAHAQIYTVGLRDNSYSPQRMSLLARAGGGAFIESTSSQLAGVFTRIEAGLTSAYVVRYRSTAPLGHRVGVSISVDGVPQAATLSYTSPAAPPPPRPPGTKTVASKSFWASTLALVVASAFAALILGFGLVALLAPRLRRAGLRGRVREFTTSVVAEAPELMNAPGSSPLPRVERLLERTRWWGQFKEDADIGRMKREPVELVGMTAVGSIGVAVVLGLAFGTVIPSFFALLLGPLVLWSLVKHLLRKQRELFAEQLPTHLHELASAMRAGHSLVSGLTSMARAAPEPSRDEWARVLADEQLGRPLDEAMLPLAQRMASDDIGQVALVAALHQQTGGNMAEVLERVADSVRERGELRRELKALTAQARLSRYVVTGLPPAVAGAIALLNPSYIRPLFHTSTGLTLLFVAVALLIGASVVMRAITNIKV